MIALEDVKLRDELDPRLSDRDDDLIEQYADIFDALPPIEINLHNELIDGWHRVRAAEHANRAEIAYVVVETKDDDDLADKMWDANLRHGVQYTRVQRQTHGLKLHKRGLPAKDIADRVGVGASPVYRWTKEHREKAQQERDAEIHRLSDGGKHSKKSLTNWMCRNRQYLTDLPKILNWEKPVKTTIRNRTPMNHHQKSRNQTRAKRQPKKNWPPKIPNRNRHHRQNRYQSRRTFSKPPAQSWVHSPRYGPMTMSLGSRHKTVNG